MTAPTPAEALARLSLAQREAVKRLPDSGGPIWHGNIMIRRPTAVALEIRGLFKRMGKYWFEPTPLGLQVRALIENEDAK